jgi:hypothetical protein
VDAPPRPERWIVARETAVQGVTLRPKLGYTVLADAKPFDSFEAASAWIKKHDLPLGWVAMQDSQSPWPTLFPSGVAGTVEPERVKVGELLLPGISGEEYDEPELVTRMNVLEQLQERLVRDGKDRVLDLFVEVRPRGVLGPVGGQPE